MVHVLTAQGCYPCTPLGAQPPDPICWVKASRYEP